MKSEEHTLLKARAFLLARERFGSHVTFCLPGMIRMNGKKGRFPAISVTGKECTLACQHCRGRLLETMLPVKTPAELKDLCRSLAAGGNHGVLISGGSTRNGFVPWGRFRDVIREIKDTTNLWISMHTGFLDTKKASTLKQAGVDQVLLDVVGDDGVYRRIFGLRNGVSRLRKTIDALKDAHIRVAPHIILGIDHGAISSEYLALEFLKQYQPEIIVLVVLMPLSGTPMNDVQGPPLDLITRIFTETRIAFPDTVISLGCARPRHRTEIEKSALECGINRLAVPSEESMEYARELGLEARFQDTCCTVDFREAP